MCYESHTVSPFRKIMALRLSTKMGSRPLGKFLSVLPAEPDSSSFKAFECSYCSPFTGSYLNVASPPCRELS